ncbi:MAG: NAD(P)/FAD-dependent oxidoreductase [Acidobacteriota bacterium]
MIVVGAGPAGNKTALGLASRGYSVSVIDSRHDIGNKLCTGIVSQECIRRFPIDLDLVYRNVSSARVVPPTGTPIDFEADSPPATIVDRIAYVASFAAQARGAGANYKLGERVVRIVPERNGVTVVTGQGTYWSRAVVVAAGFGSPLCRQLGLGTVPDYVTGAQAMVEAKGMVDVEVYLGRDVAPGFFSWVVPIAGNRALVGLLARKQATRYLTKFIGRQREAGRISTVITQPSCWGIPLRPLKKTFQDRVLVVGDAAGQVKPTTGGGIYYSLMAGEIAAETLAESLNTGDLSATCLEYYQRRWKDLISRELEVGYSARRLFEFLSDHQIRSLVQQAGANGIRADLMNSADGSFDWHSRLISKVMRHPVLGGALRLVNPLLAHLTRPADAEALFHEDIIGLPEPLAKAPN